MTLFWSNPNGNSVLDPYYQAPHAFYPPYIDVNGKTPRSPVLGAGTNLVVAVGGDSMSTGLGPSAVTPSNTLVQNFNSADGAIYDYVDPPVGAGRFGTGAFDGTISAYLGDALRTAGASRVIMVPFGVPATTLAQWADPDFLGTHTIATMRRLSSVGLSPDAVVFIAGPNDTNGGTSQASCTASLSAIIAMLRANGVPKPKPILICPCSTFAGAAGPNPRAAQAAVIDVPNNVHAGPDSDTFAFQADNTHHSDAGLSAFAAAIQTTLHGIGAPF